MSGIPSALMILKMHMLWLEDYKSIEKSSSDSLQMRLSFIASLAQ